MLRRFSRSLMLCATLALEACLGSCGSPSGNVQPNTEQNTPEIAGNDADLFGGAVITARAQLLE